MAKSFPVTIGNIKDVDDVFESVGGFGKFQIFILFLLLSLEIPAAFVVFSPIFTGRTPNEWLCEDETVSKSDPNFCSLNCTLTSTESSIVAEWGLICKFSWVSDFITTLQMLGMVFGNIFTGQCADWYGRRWTYLGNVCWLAFGTLLSAVAPNVFVYAAARLICGAGFSGFIFLSMTYAMEFMTPDWRSICSSVGPFGEGIMLLGLTGYYFQHSWRTLLLVSAIPFSLIFLIFPLIPESPRWLLRNKKIEEAHKVFGIIAKMNQTVPIDIEVLWKVADFDRNSEVEKVEKIGYIEFFKNKEMRFITFCLMSIWSSWAIMYFGISYNIKNVGGNPYLNVIFMGLCDAIGYPCSYFMNSICTRRRSLAIFMSGSAIFLVSLAVLQLFMELSEQPVVILCLCLLGKFCAAGGRASCRTLTGESYPTAVRNMGFGVIGVSASAVGLVAPQIAYLGSIWPSAPLFIFGGCSLLGAAVSFLLKETKGQPMNEEMRKKRKISISSIVHVVRRLSSAASIKKEIVNET